MLQNHNHNHYDVLKINDKCLLLSNVSNVKDKFNYIVNIQHNHYDQPMLVYTFQTEIYHNYFADNILVHNKVEFDAPDVEKKKNRINRR